MKEENYSSHVCDMHELSRLENASATVQNVIKLFENNVVTSNDVTAITYSDMGQCHQINDLFDSRNDQGFQKSNSNPLQQDDLKTKASEQTQIDFLKL